MFNDNKCEYHISVTKTNNVVSFEFTLEINITLVESKKLSDFKSNTLIKGFELTEDCLSIGKEYKSKRDHYLFTPETQSDFELEFKKYVASILVPFENYLAFNDIKTTTNSVTTSVGIFLRK